jgi:predicted nucleotidyltransferase
VLRDRYGPQYTVELFGSTAYGVSSASSDLDVSVVSPHLVSTTERTLSAFKIDGDRPDGFAPDVDMENLP